MKKRLQLFQERREAERKHIEKYPNGYVSNHRDAEPKKVKPRTNFGKEAISLAARSLNPNAKACGILLAKLKQLKRRGGRVFFARVPKSTETYVVRSRREALKLKLRGLNVYEILDVSKNPPPNSTWGYDTIPCRPATGLDKPASGPPKLTVAMWHHAPLI